MSTTPIYYIYEKTLSDETVEKILEISKNDWGIATIDNSQNPNLEELYKVRKTDIIWNTDQWLYDLFWPYMEETRQETGWSLEISCAESFQLGRYQDGGHYTYHIDSLGFDKEDKPGSIIHQTVRKISMVCWLNEDFEGGEFEFNPAYFSGKEHIIKPTKGTVVFFPSWVLHKVHPVTKGTRYSLVTWFRGQPVT